MASNYHIVVEKSTRDLIRNECKKEFLRHNPLFEKIPITDNMIILRMAKFYLDMEVKKNEL